MKIGTILGLFVARLFGDEELEKMIQHGDDYQKELIIQEELAKRKRNQCLSCKHCYSPDCKDCDLESCEHCRSEIILCDLHKCPELNCIFYKNSEVINNVK